MAFDSIILLKQDCDVFDELRRVQQDEGQERMPHTICAGRRMATHEIPKVIECARTLFDIDESLLQ